MASILIPMWGPVVSAEWFSEEDAHTLQKIGLCLDSLRQKGFVDARTVGDQVWVLLGLTQRDSRLEDIFKKLEEVSAKAVSKCKETERRVFEMVKGLSEEIAKAQKGQKVPAESQSSPTESPKTEPGPPPPLWQRCFKDTLSYGQSPPMEEPAPSERETPRGSHGR